MSHTVFFILLTELFQHPIVPKAIQNAQKLQSKIAKCSEIH